MRDWQLERHQHGENPFDWNAFRVVVGYVGGSDPGDDPPTEFFWFTPPDGTPVLFPGSPPPHRAFPPLVSSPRRVSVDLVRSTRTVHPGITEMKYWR